MIVNLTPAFVATQLIVPAGLKKKEFRDSVVRGLMIEARSTPNSIPTWCLRQKWNGVNYFDYLGTIRELTVSQARKLATQKKAERVASPKQAPEQKLGLAEITLDAFWTFHFYPTCQLHLRSAGRSEQLYRLWLKERFGDIKLADLSRSQFLQYQAELATTALSPASQDHVIKLARRLLNYAVELELLERNVLKGIKLRLVDNSVENYLDETQLKQLVEVLKIDTCRTPAMALLILVSTGARVTEALTATWNNIDVEAGVWKVDAIRAKGKRSRNIPLNDSAKWVLEQLESKGESEYLFPSPVKNDDGRETHYKRISRGFWSRIKKLSGVPANVRVHDIRHSYLSLLARKGASQSYLQAIAGHSDYRMTKRYVHLAQSEINEIANLASVIASGETTL